MRFAYVHGCCNSSVDEDKVMEVVAKRNSDWTKYINQSLGAIAEPIDFFFEGDFESEFAFYTNTLNSFIGQNSDEVSPFDDSFAGSFAHNIVSHAETVFLNELIASESSLTDPFDLNTSNLNNSSLSSESGSVNKLLHNFENALANLGVDDNFASFYIKNFVPDTNTYIKNKKARSEVDQIVMEVIKDADVIIAHSLGSIVTYNVLNHFQALEKKPHFITIGSPLGFASIQKILNFSAFPSSIKSWTNLIIPGDIVATEIFLPISNNMSLIRNRYVKPFPNRVKDDKHAWENYLSSKQLGVALNEIMDSL